MRSFAQIGAALALGLSSGCTASKFDALEANDDPACGLDGGSWAGDAQTARYAREAFAELDRNMPAFLERLEQAVADNPGGDVDFADLHAEAKTNIYRLGRLLPRMERAMDLSPMIGQMTDRVIWSPLGDHRTEYLRVAIAQEYAFHQNSAEHMAQFLSDYQELEAILLGFDPDTADERDLARLRGLARSMPDLWQAASFGFQQIIFDRPDMPEGESFSERIGASVRGMCTTYLECAMPDGSQCGGTPVVGGKPEEYDPAGDAPMAEPY